MEIIPISITHKLFTWSACKSLSVRLTFFAGEKQGITATPGFFAVPGTALGKT
jgi:hypothetical protein